MATDDEQEQLFVLTKRVKEALELINALDETKLVVIVKRLAKNVGIKGAPFSAEELEQLQEHLVLGEGQVLQRLRTSTQGTHPTLESVDWRLHIQTAASGLAKIAEPRTILSLKLNKANCPSEVVPMELTHQQLASLLTQLDAAQQQLDALS